MLVHPQQAKDNDNNPQTMNIQSTQPTNQFTFNVVVVGQAGIGKSSLIKLLLDTCHLSTHTSLPQLARLAEFANFAATCPTNSPSSVIAELPLTPNRPQIALKLIDTPGLLYHDTHELEAGLQLVLRQISEAFDSSSTSVRNFPVPANGINLLKPPLFQAQERRDKQIHL